MGSQVFTVNSRGMSAREAYNNAVEEANDEYGHQQGYSGEINSTPGFRDATEAFKKSGLSMNQFIEKRLDELSKHDGAECICIRQPRLNKNKIKTQVEHIVTPGTKKWVLKYTVHTIDGKLSSHDKKGDAVKAARAYTEKYLSSTHITMEKVLEKCDAVVAKIKYKRSSDEGPGEYKFYGWASC